jgi:hypothetical protein
VPEGARDGSGKEYDLAVESCREMIPIWDKYPEKGGLPCIWDSLLLYMSIDYDNGMSIGYRET